MKKLLSISPTKIYLACGLGLAMTIGSFWHHQMNQSKLDRLNVLSQGTATCFNRVSQTFTAFMIKDAGSQYLSNSFMGLSNECLKETVAASAPFRNEIEKGFETLNQLVSEVHWFHEKIAKVTSVSTPINQITERFGKMELLKTSIADNVDETMTDIREVQVNDEYMMGAGLILFVLSISMLSLQDFARIQRRREIEREALNAFKAGGANVGAIVDQLVEKALCTEGYGVISQIFKDYHEDVLEKMSSKSFTIPKHTKVEEEELVEIKPEINEERTSLKEILVSLQNIQDKEVLQVSEVRDVNLNISYEIFEQMMNAAISQLANRRSEKKKVVISNQIHSDRSIVNIFLAGSTFTASELEFATSDIALAQEIDMNLVILKEMVNESGAQWYLENKADRHGNITGMNIRFTVMRSSKDIKKNLISVVRGKKKDLARELMN